MQTLSLRGVNKYDRENVTLIEAAAQRVFGENYTFGKLKILERPYTEFQLPMLLYNQFDVILEYERSTVGVMLRTEAGYVGLSKMTDE